MRCDQCKHWDAEENDFSAVGHFGMCNKIESYESITQWSRTADGALGPAVLRPEYADQQIFTRQEFAGDIMTRADFFCAHFEPKPDVG